MSKPRKPKDLLANPAVGPERGPWPGPWPGRVLGLALAILAAAFLVMATGLLPACSGRGQREEYKLEVTIGKTTPRELVRNLGPPLERTTGPTDRPLERLHFNVPFNRNIHLEIRDKDNKITEKLIRGKNVMSFYFTDGLLSGVD